MLARLECESLLDLNFGLPSAVTGKPAPRSCQRKTHRIAVTVVMITITFDKYTFKGLTFETYTSKHRIVDRGDDNDAASFTANVPISRTTMRMQRWPTSDYMGVMLGRGGCGWVQ